ncbi:hypothetical protein ACQJBY_028580 [Aegilops geniculata]
MADAAFSIREYAASMLAAEEWRLLRIEDLPPLRAPRYRWWAYELASTVAATAAEASPRRAPGQTRPPNKRSISDLFPAAPPLAVVVAGCKEQTEVDGDQVLCAIARRAKEEKKRKRKLQDEEEGQKEETAAVDAAPESSGGREPEGNFPARKGLEGSSDMASQPQTDSVKVTVNVRPLITPELAQGCIRKISPWGPGSIA